MSMSTIPWWDGVLIGFDTETTGVDVEQDRIVTANLTYEAPGQEVRTRDFLFNPGIEIPEGASAVHGISTEHAREHGQDPREGLAELIELLRTSAERGPLVAFNGVFDFTILDREARRHGLEPFVPTAVIDPLIMDKHVDKWRKGRRTLGVVAEVYGVTLTNAHSADADSLAAVRVARALGGLGAFPGDMAELTAWLIETKAEQSADLQAYFARKRAKECAASGQVYDPADDVKINGEFPVIAYDPHALAA